MKLSEILTRDYIIPELKSSTKHGVLKEFAELIAGKKELLNKDSIRSALNEREKLGSTGIENGVAIPHAKIEGLEEIILAVGINPKGVEFDAHDGEPSFLFFTLLAPINAAGIHLKVLARLSKLLKKNEFRNKLRHAKSITDIYDIIIEEDKKLVC